MLPFPVTFERSNHNRFLHYHTSIDICPSQEQHQFEMTSPQSVVSSLTFKFFQDYSYTELMLSLILSNYAAA